MGVGVFAGRIRIVRICGGGGQCQTRPAGNFAARTGVRRGWRIRRGQISRTRRTRADAAGTRIVEGCRDGAGQSQAAADQRAADRAAISRDFADRKPPERRIRLLPAGSATPVRVRRSRQAVPSPVQGETGIQPRLHFGIHV
ncbi:hypothetical protein SDC9_144934 [bioreactor metagenome]|uniref:Uncharacterized protein n=1 Tax=bioreactor metagenome TaxID=1076179 RepID=A0A645E7F2_9ZZZZ